MSDEDQRNDERDPGERMAWTVGLGTALGVGIGTAVFAVSDEPFWIAIGAGLGAAFGAAFSAMRDE